MVESFYENLVNEKNNTVAAAAPQQAAGEGDDDEDDKQETPVKAEEAPAEEGLTGQKRAREEDEAAGEEANKEPKVES